MKTIGEYISQFDKNKIKYIRDNNLRRINLNYQIYKTLEKMGVDKYDIDHESCYKNQNGTRFILTSTYHEINDSRFLVIPKIYSLMTYSYSLQL